MAEDLHVIGIQVEADSSQAGKLTRALQELAIQMERTAQSQQRLRDNMKQNATQMQATGGATGYMMGQMKALAAQMLAMVGIVALVNKGIHEFGSAISETSRLAEQQDMFGDLVDNAKKSQAALQAIMTWWRSSGGIFDQKDILDAANALAGMRVKAEAIPAVLQHLGEAANTAGGSLSEWVGTMQTFLTGRFIGAGTEQMKLLLEQVAEAAGKTVETIKQDLSKAKPDELIASLEVGLQRLGTAGKTMGQTADAASRYEGQLKILASRWLDLKQQFGAPIVDALTPILTSWTENMGNGQTTAQEMGKTIAEVFSDMGKALEDVPWKKIFDVMVDGMKAFAAVTKSTADDLKVIKSIGSDLQKAWEIISNHDRKGYPATVPQGWSYDPATGRTWNPLTQPPTSSLIVQPPPSSLVGSYPQAPTNPFVQGLMNPPASFDMTANAQAAAAAAVPAIPKGALSDVIAGIKNLDAGTKQLTGDAKTLTDFWQEMTDAWQNSTTASALQAAQLAAVEKAAKSLVDPVSKVAELTQGMAPDTAVIAKWILYEEAAQRAIALTDLRMKAGMASMGESVTQGLKLMVRSWGTWQEQVSKGIQDIGNALVSNISGGLKEILNGTKSVEEGFRDMALGIIQAIEDVILKMLVQLAIQEAITALSGGSWFGGSAISGQVAGPIRPAIAVGHQAGGRIGSGYGGGDRVPIMGEEGEFMINKKSARSFGYDKLARINRMQEGGRVPAGSNRGGGFINQSEIPFFNPNTGDYFFGDPNFEPMPLNQSPLLDDPSWQNQLVSPNSIWSQLYGSNMTLGQVVQIVTAAGGTITAADLGLPPSSLGTGNTGSSGSGSSHDWTQGVIAGTVLTAADKARIAARSGEGGRGLGMWGAPMGGGPNWPAGPNTSSGVSRLGSYQGGRGGYFGHSSGPVSNSTFGFPTLGVAMPAAAGGGAYGGMTMAKIFMHTEAAHASGAFAFMQNYFHGIGGGAGGGMGSFGAGVGGAGRPMTHNFHGGGIVDKWSAMASGGVVRANEGVFTEDQMASMQPASPASMNQINVSVTNVNGPTESKAEGSGLSNADARELARLITAVCDERIMKQRHVGGALYIPRSQRGG